MTSTRTRRAAAAEASERRARGEQLPIVNHACMTELNGDLFVKALSAVLAHAGEDEDSPRFYRVRVEIDGKQMTLSAGDSFSCGVYLLETFDPVPGPVQFDLRPKDVQILTRIYKPVKDMPCTLRLSCTAGGRVRVQKVGQLEGLQEGTAFEPEPHLAGEGEMPRYPATLALLLSATKAEPAPVTSIKPIAFRSMATTAGVLGFSPEVTGTRENGPLLVRIGPDFVGLMATYDDPDRERSAKDRADARVKLLQRLPEPSADTLARQQARFDLRTAAGVYTVADANDGQVDSDQTPPPLDFTTAEGRGVLAQCAEFVITAQYASVPMLIRKGRLRKVDADAVFAELVDLGIVAGDGEDGEDAPVNRDVLFDAEDAAEVALCLTHGTELPADSAAKYAFQERSGRLEAAGLTDADVALPVPGVGFTDRQ